MLDFSLQVRVGLDANGVAIAFFVRPVYRRAIERTTFSMVVSGLDKPGAKRLLRLTQHRLGPPSDVVHREIRSKLFGFLGGDVILLIERLGGVAGRRPYGKYRVRSPYGKIDLHDVFPPFDQRTARNSADCSCG